MKLSIKRCAICNKIRLVDFVNNKWICFACKQKMRIKRSNTKKATTNGKTQ